MDVPHEQARVQVAAINLGAGPPLTPLAEPVDQWPQLLPGRGELILAPSAVRPRQAPDDPGVFELFQALGEKRGRHERHPAVEVAESAAAAEQFPEHERGPPLGNDLGCLGDRAELPVASHNEWSVVSRAGRRKSIFCYLRERAARAIVPRQGGAPWLFHPCSTPTIATSRCWTTLPWPRSRDSFAAS